MNGLENIESRQLRILLIEDNPADAMLLQETLMADANSMRFLLHAVDRLSKAFEYLGEAEVDIILLDLSLPDSHDIDTFIRLNTYVSGVPIVILTGNQDEAMARQALQLGAQDYLIKGDLNSRMIQRVIEYSIERAKLKQQLMVGEERFKTLIEQNRDGILIVDKSLIVRYVNPAALNMLQQSPASMIGEEVQLDFLPGEIVREQISYQNGDIRFIDIICRCIDWQNEKVFMITLSDITEQKRAHEISTQNAALQHVQELAGAICHEFSQPLQTLWFLQGLDETQIDRDKNRAVFTKMMTRMKDLLDDLREIKVIKKQGYMTSKIIDIRASSKVEN